ncbi:COP1-interacting protein 7 [Cornus florida]|uniref:COP1-interacting protein 7 n=1 Tax=Cornus florida TaxID=4283 RepID=UPI002899B09E|nr:COP1-interacting protein 7 [Cornus florida]
MDPRTRLDHALFQLTPTRTRCDLVIFAGGANEKLASGLLEPFLSHLKSAKDQIQKGGYSVTLQPPSRATDVSWFTKATLERFVRFVSTPEVLERFVTIEREIEQIENSVPLTVAAETEGNLSNGTSDAAQEENPKVRLQRVLEARKAMLRKEQAMAYARALVAGFEMDYIDDLISFADAFGASRLRGACVNFMELCKRKNDDGLWMDEVAAMQASQAELSYMATSGIILAGEDYGHSQDFMINVQNGGLSSSKQNASIDASDSTISHGSLDINQDNSLPTSSQMHTTDAKAQIPMSWPNHLPQYMHNFQGPFYQQMPPYQGYPFQGMPVAPPYYPGNMPWPSNVEDSAQGLEREPDDRRNHRSSSRNREKFSHGKGSKMSEQGDNTEPSDSNTESDSDEYLQHEKKISSTEQLRKTKKGKRSSGKVVIRNINYITSKRDGGKGGISEGDSSEDEFIDGESLKQQVEEAVGSLERHHKSTSRVNRKREGSQQHSLVNGSRDAVNINDVVENKSEGAKGNENWDIFQNILLKDADSGSNGIDSHPVQVQEEYFGNKNSGEGVPIAFNMEMDEVTKHHAISSDSFVVTQRGTGNEGNNILIKNLEAGENIRQVIKNRDGTYEELLFSQRIEESENYSRATLSDCATEASTVKIQKGGDWFLSGQPNTSAAQDKSLDCSIFDGDHTSSLVGDGNQSQTNRRDAFVDDSFMVQARQTSYPYDSQMTTDICMVSDIIGATEQENSKPDNLQEKVEATSVCEPDDLYMVLGRNSTAEQTVTTWNPEMDYANNNSLTEAVKRHSHSESTESVDAKLPSNGKATNSKTRGAPEAKVSNKEARSKALVGSLAKSKSEITSRGKKPSSVSRTMVQKSKSVKEEESRKKKEELLTERQKRIAERSAAGGSTPATSKRNSKETKTAIASVKSEKLKSQSSIEETKKLHKPVLRSSTIDRLAAARISHELSSAESKSNQPRKAALKENGVMGTTISQKSAGAGNKKQSANKVRPSDKKNSPKELHSSLSDAQEKKDHVDAIAPKSVELRSAQATQASSDGIDDSENIKELCSVSSIEKNGGDMNSERENLDDKSGNRILPNGDLRAPSEDFSPEYDNGVISEGSMALHEDTTVSKNGGESITYTTARALPTSPDKALNNFENGSANEDVPVTPEISEIEISTPPPNIEMSPEPVYSRKKWNSGESSPKAAKGFRKLLMFGRKS